VAEIRIPAEPRTDFGKGAARRVRRAGKIPAVVYGHGSDPVHVSLPGHELMLALKTPNVLLELALDSGVTLVLPKSVQRDPVRHSLEHLDLVIVKRGEKVVVDVPVSLTGKIAGGGLVELQQPTLSVETEATHIPTELVVDLEGAEIGTSIRAGEVVLPAGTTLAADPDSLVVAVVAPQAAEEEAAPAEGEEAAAAPAGEAEAGSADEG